MCLAEQTSESPHTLNGVQCFCTRCVIALRPRCTRRLPEQTVPDAPSTEGPNAE